MLKYQWTDGSSPERSHKSQKPSQKPLVNDNVDYTNRVSSVVDPCMMKPPTTNMIPDLAYHRAMDNGEPSREDTHFKMAERDLMAQTGQNPFFAYGEPSLNSYADQVAVQDKFLKPISTVFTDKTKVNQDQFQNT